LTTSVLLISVSVLFIKCTVAPSSKVRVLSWMKALLWSYSIQVDAEMVMLLPPRTTSLRQQQQQQQQTTSKSGAASRLMQRW
jgi:hypothetical protein